VLRPGQAKTLFYEKGGSSWYSMKIGIRFDLKPIKKEKNTIITFVFPSSKEGVGKVHFPMLSHAKDIAQRIFE
jgi:hypothetical protein